MLPLNQLPVGNTAFVIQLNAAGTIRRRLMDLGFTEGTAVKCVRRSPAGDPTAYLVRGAVIALRREEAAQIIMSPAQPQAWTHKEAGSHDSD